MKSYTTRDVARLLGLSEAQVRSQARVGYLSPDRGPHNAYRFSFQDLVLLRAAKALSEARIAPGRIRRALRTLTRQLPAGRSLSALRLSSEGDRIVARDGGHRWHPESGQLLLDFCVADLAGRTAKAVRRGADARLTVEQWYDARVNLGRWLQEDGHPELAIVEYQAALASRPKRPTAPFNLGTAFEQLGRRSAAIGAYHRALDADDRFADAHLNLARLYQQTGKFGAARKHRRAYQMLSGQRDLP
jgi:tetratricopeptide (TPR) repeat protein